jgi:uncharacterized GH25 family protein
MPKINFSIRVVNNDGKGVKGIKVFINYGMTHHQDTTDGDGWVKFNKDQFLHSSASGEVYINSRSQGQYSFSDGATYSFTV